MDKASSKRRSTLVSLKKMKDGEVPPEERYNCIYMIE
jgi:hypothetical protein